VVSSAPFTIDVTGTAPPPFSLKAPAAAVKLAQGGRAKVKISTVRRGYQGPVAVELRNLPAGVTAAKGVIPTGQDEVEVELSATSAAALGGRKDVAALGTATAPASPPVLSPSFTLDVIKAPAQEFTLRVESGPVQVKPGGKAKVTVVADRGKGYQGPITVELRNLPSRLTASQGVIPPGKDRVSLELIADSKAVPGDKPDVSAQGQSSAGDTGKVSSPPFLVSVQAVAGGHPATARPGNPANHPKPPAGPHPAPTPRPKPNPKTEPKRG
jgi:hypothetical protein